jgi:hypothetical protein
MLIRDFLQLLFVIPSSFDIRISSFSSWRRASVRSGARPWTHSGGSSRCWGNCWRGCRAWSGSECRARCYCGTRCWRWWSTRLSAVCSAIVEIVHVASTTPNDHFAASPDCRVVASAGRRVGSACGSPAIGFESVSPDRVARLEFPAAPNDHLVAGPHRSVPGAGSRSVGGVGRCPTICIGIISSSGAYIDNLARTSPDNHLAAGPNRRVTGTRSRRIGGSGRCPTVRDRTVAVAGVQSVDAIVSAPNNHFGP